MRCLLVLILCLKLTSCVPLMVGAGAGAGVIGTKVIAQDKTIGESVSDTTIWTKIRAGFIREKIAESKEINVEVNEGRVLLTGFVQNYDDILKALRVVWEQNGVKEVINEMKVKTRDNSTGVFDDMKDGWTTTQIKAKLLFNHDIKSSNYSIETINSVVYLFGIATTNQELAKVKEIASNASGSKKVISYIRVRKELDARIEDTKGEKPIAKQDKLDMESVKEASSEKDDPDDAGDSVENIFDNEKF